MSELLNNLYLSFLMVIDSPGYALYLGSVISLGMTVGWKLNEGREGFTRSLTVILPIFLLITFNTLSRVYFISLEAPIGANAFNSVIARLIDVPAYCLGLYIGHVLAKKAIISVYKDKGLKPKESLPKL